MYMQLIFTSFYNTATANPLLYDTSIRPQQHWFLNESEDLHEDGSSEHEASGTDLISSPGWKLFSKKRNRRLEETLPSVENSQNYDVDDCLHMGLLLPMINGRLDYNRSNIAIGFAIGL